MDRNCCQNPDIKIISGLYTCIKCGVVHQPCLTHEWVEYNRQNVVQRKSVYNRTDHVETKLQKLRLNANEIQAFMQVWTLVEDHLKKISDKRFPKIDFFIDKILQGLNIPKQVSYKINSSSRIKYEAIWNEMF